MVCALTGFVGAEEKIASKVYQDIPAVTPASDRNAQQAFGSTSKAWDGVDTSGGAEVSKQFFGFSYRPMFARVFPRPPMAPGYLNSGMIGGNNYNARLLANRWLAAMNTDDPDRIKILTAGTGFFALDNGVKFTRNEWSPDYAVSNWCCAYDADDSTDCDYHLLTKETYFQAKPDGFVLEFDVRDKDNNSGRCIVKTGFLSVQVNGYGKAYSARVYWVPSASNCVGDDYAFGSKACTTSGHWAESLYEATQHTGAYAPPTPPPAR